MIWHLPQYTITRCTEMKVKIMLVNLILCLILKNSKLMCYNMLSDTKPIIKLCNQLVQGVDGEVYLGSKIYNNVNKILSDYIV